MLCKGRPNQKMMNSILLFAAGMIMLFLGKGSWDIRQAFLLQQQTQEKRELCRQLCEDLSDSVDFLSESAGRFVISGDKEYLEAYWNEVRQGQRRNRIIESLQALELPGEEARLLETAKKKFGLTDLYGNTFHEACRRCLWLSGFGAAGGGQRLCA